MFRLTLKELGAKKLRLMTTAVAVMLGVAFMAGTLVLTATISRTFDGLFADGYAGTDAYVRGTSELDSDLAQRPRLDIGTVDTISSVDGVAAAEGKVSGYAQLVDSNGEAVGDPDAGMPTFGESWMTVEDLNPYRIADGHAPEAPNEIVIDRKSADTGSFEVGDVATVLTKSGSDQFTISGIATFDEADSMGGASAVLFEASTAQSLVGEPGKVDAISVVADEGVSQDELTARIGQALPSETEVLTGAEIVAETQGDVKEDMAFFNTFLMVFAVIALFVGAFIIFNTFSITVAQRQKEMALLRALGASRRQVTRSVIIEALAVGLIASLSGIAAGVGIASLLKMLLSAFGIDIPAGGMVVGASTVIISLVVGTVVTVVSAFMPARRAGRVPPVAAMRDVAIDRTGTSKSRMVAGTALLAAGVGALVAGLSGAGIALVGLGALVMFIAVATLAPVIARPAARAIGWPMTKTGMAGHLGRQNAMRNPKRTASTAAALMIGVALVGFIMTFASSAKASVGSAVDKDFRGDFVLESPGVTSSLATDLAAESEFSAVTSSRSAPAEVDGVAQTLSSWNASTVASLFDMDPQQGDLATLGTDGIALEDSYAEDHGWTIGSQIPVIFSQGQTTLTVEAIFGEADWTGTAVIDHALLDSFGMDALDLNIYVQVADGVDAATAGRLLDEAALALPSVEVMDHDEFKASRSGQIDMILNLIYALLGLAIVIALIGITNTLALSIFERTRELGLLRAIGMTRGQLRATVRWESMIIALFGTGLGLMIGIFFGWTIVSALAAQGFSEFVVPTTSLAFVTGIAAVAGVAAAALPARRAARMDVLGAIATQ